MENIEVKEQARRMAVDIGNAFGEVSIASNGIVVFDNGDDIRRYRSISDFLVDMAATMAENQRDGGFNWEKELVFIHENVKQFRGVTKYDTQNKGIRWGADVWDKSYEGVRDPGHLSKKGGGMRHLGTFSSLCEALLAVNAARQLAGR